MAQATWDLGRESHWRQVLARWRRRLGRVEPRAPDPAFVPVHVAPGPAGGLGPWGRTEVVLANGRCLRVGPGFDPHTLVTLVDLLEDRGPSC